MKLSRKIWVPLVVIVVLASIGYSYFYKSEGKTKYQTKYEQASVYTRFNMEIFDKIVENYWQKVSEPDLAKLYQLVFAKAASSTPIELSSATREGVAEMLSQGFDQIPEAGQNELAVNTGIIVLANLAPQGRSGLLSQEQETAFRDNVNNIDRATNLYSNLGLNEGADIAKVNTAYEEKSKELMASTSPEAKQELAQVERAHEVLSNESSKVIYDQTKSEPTLSSRKLSNGSLYLDLTKISNTTLQEVANVLSAYGTTTASAGQATAPTGIIIDVRSNAGGALDFARYFMSFFLGPNQYVYDYFHQGDLNPERTPNFAKVDVLSKVQDIAILTDGQTQSTSELLSAIFKRFHMAKTVGTQTKGWGTVENTFPLDTDMGDGNKYSVLLVHSLTLRDDGEPIEGRGVDPDIDTSNSNWKREVQKSFSSAFASDLVGVLGK